MTVANAVAQQFKQLNLGAHKNNKRKGRKALLETLDAAIEADKLTGLK
ncbi:MAG: hypothetical protein WAV85_04670 [Rhodoferax sp.]